MILGVFFIIISLFRNVLLQRYKISIQPIQSIPYSDTIKHIPIDSSKITSNKNSTTLKLKFNPEQMKRDTLNITDFSSYNRQGGIVNDYLTIDEFPKPKYLFETINENAPMDSLFKTEIRLTIDSKKPVKLLGVKGISPSIIDMNIVPEGTGIFMILHGYKSMDGFPCLVIQDAFGNFIISITSTEPDSPHVKCSENIDFQ